jgi:hypothetical protein
MSTDQIDVMVGDAEVRVRFAQLAASVCIRAAEGRGEERLQVTPLSAKIDSIEERRYLWIADEAIVEQVDEGVDADHAAEPLEGRRFGRRGHAGTMCDCVLKPCWARPVAPCADRLSSGP